MDFDSIPFDDNSFDIAIFYLVLIDIEPMTPAIQEAFRVLKPGGRCVVVNCTSMNTATNRFWDRNEQGEKVAWLVEHYGTSQMVLAEWNGIKVHNYHRPLSAYLTQFLETGFRLASFDEPIPTESELDIDPGLAPHLICPLFNLQVWQK